jgi:hypothetical protein
VRPDGRQSDAGGVEDILGAPAARALGQVKTRT